MKTKNNKLFDKQLLRESLRASVRKLAPRTMIKNPIMFTVEIVTAMMLTMLFYILLSGDTSQGTFGYNLVIFLVLLATLLFANFAEAIAEARGKAQADSLRKTREETPAKLVAGGSVQIISSSALKKNDIFECVAGDTIPADGEIIEGLASIDESAITGESAPVIREAGGDKSSVTGGTKVLSDRIRAKVTAQPGESFLDKMIALVEGASRQKTPNEIALTILLAGFTLVFVIVCATLKPFADYVGANLTIAALISLFVCLIPTTIGGLLSAIGIAGMDRALQANVITKSGRAVETAGDVDTLLLDKTGTITIGNRKATRFHPIAGTDPAQLIRTCMLSSVSDETPEGKSILELGRSQNVTINDMEIAGARMIKFTAETKCSGADLADGRRIRKGAFEAIRRIVEQAGHPFDTEVERTVKKISENGGTPLVVCENEKVTGVIELQDIIKPGIRERFDRLRRMGVKTDNDPTKLIEIVEIGKQLLMTRGTLTTFSIANDVAKYFAIVPALFIAAIPSLEALNLMHLHSPESAILSAVIFNAIIIPLLIPLALRGVKYKPIGASALLRRNLFIYGLGGVIVPFIGIKLIDMFISLFC